MGLLNNNMSFKQFLLNENETYLGQQIGDVLSALHDLEQNKAGMGNREVTSTAEGIVNRIRRILHTNWGKDYEKHLKTLQKVGVSVMQAIDEKGELEDTLASSASEIEDMLGKMGVPQNNLGITKDTNDEDEKESSVEPSQGNQDKSEKGDQQQQQQQPQQPPQMPPAAGIPGTTGLPGQGPQTQPQMPGATTL